MADLNKDLGLKQEIESNIEFPQAVYVNLPERYATLFFTAPTSNVQLHANPVAERTTKKGEISIVLKNNQTYTVVKKGHRDIVEAAKYYLPDLMYNYFLSQDLSHYSQEGLVELLVTCSTAGVTDPQETIEIKANLEYLISSMLSDNGKLKPQKAKDETEIQGMYYRGTYFDFNDRDKVKERYENDSEYMREISPVQAGKYLYRTPDKQEFHKILKVGYFQIPIETNFEVNIGPQVQSYSEEPGYAGVVIRVKCPGPYFSRKGFQVPRITSMTAMFAEVEILDGENWLSLEEYTKKIHNQKQ
jgi:hypothetical protein